MFTDTTVNELVSSDHKYRELAKLLDIKLLSRRYRRFYSTKGSKGISIDKAIKMLLIQFMEDYSDREMERAVQENLAVKWYVGYELRDKTPDHSYLGKFRKRIGTKGVQEIFDYVVRRMKKHGLVSDVFQFVDASAIVSKVQLWTERDEALAACESKLDNSNVDKYGKDSQARIGCKGKDKYWYGYKRHVCVDMQQGVIVKTAVTPANVSDAEGLKHVCPKQGMVFADKGYCTHKAQQTLRANNCHSGAIKRNNMKGKDRDKDRWLTQVRMPYEGVFSKMSNRARYRSQAKVQFQAFMQATAHNLKRWLRLRELELATC